MNRINNLFATKDSQILSIYFCAGHYTLDATVDTIKTLEQKGVDMIEIGIPFSDPMADGPVIQAAATQALSNGMTLKLLFSQLEQVRTQGVKIPLLLMGYLNPIMQYGFENFCISCNKVGVDGVIIPDLPFNDYIKEFSPIAQKYDIKVIMLITPETEDERIRLIDQNTDGFIYMVSSAAITGAQKNFDIQKDYFARIKDMNLRNPRMIGFGISNKQTLEAANANASGAIIGSKFVSLLSSNNGDAAVAMDQLYDELSK
ncbi:MAG: tryptophan synthase subunit alpha [Rikenellaceae bacterium]